MHANYLYPHTRLVEIENDEFRFRLLRVQPMHINSFDYKICLLLITNILYSHLICSNELALESQTIGPKLGILFCKL